MIDLTNELIPVTENDSTKRINKREQLVELFTNGRGNAGESRLALSKEFKSNKTTINRIINGKAYVKYTKDIELEDKKKDAK